MRKKILVNGLVLAGGKSQRMKTDKSFLDYHGKAQVIHAYEILTSLCKKIFICLRPDQAEQQLYRNYPVLTDREQFTGAGPLTGILTAFDKEPSAAWLILACDLPFADASTLKYLIQNRVDQKAATAFKNPVYGWPEPLCAIYEPNIHPRLLEEFHRGVLCPRKILMSCDVHLLELEKPHALDNINSPEEYFNAKKILKRNNRLQ